MIPLLGTLSSHIRSTLHPEGFHGGTESAGFFEGWYVKLVSADRMQRWAVIPGVFLGADTARGPDNPRTDEAFVQVLDGSTGRSWYQRYDRSVFTARDDTFDLTVAGNRFTSQGIVLDIPDARLRGEVHFTDPLAPWPVHPWAPGIMGWYAWVPFMECYHGVVSFDHGLRGTLTLDGETLGFDGGRGYIEKDWGRAFPAGYVWMQTNHFATPGTCLTASVALIPWLRGEFRGFIVGLRREGILHTFATYTGASTTSLGIDDEHVRWQLRSRRGATLDLRAERRAGGLLHAPVRTEMHRRVEETLDARVHVRLADRHGRVAFDGTGECAGLEVHGELDRLLATD